MNALLGSNVLPVVENMTFSPLCEIKWGEKKIAIVHLGKQSDEDTVPVSQRRLNLEDSGDRKIFDSFVNPSKEEDDMKDEDEPFCTKVEIFWPSECLKVCHKSSRVLLSNV